MDYYTVLIGSGLFACTYFYLYPKKFKQKIANISWYSVKIYHKAGIYLNDLFMYGDDKIYFDPESSDSSDEEEEDEHIFLEGLNENEVEILKVYANDEFEKKPYSLLFLECMENKKEFYKLVDDNTSIKDCFDYELKKLPRQFLQIEVIYDKDDKYDIHEYISKYYVEGNVLFDSLFMNYYMNKWYNLDIDHNEVNYKVNIIDKDIKLLNLEKDDFLLLTENSYEKMKKSSEELNDEDENNTV